jgi:hypothetical protein
MKLRSLQGCVTVTDPKVAICRSAQRFLAPMPEHGRTAL